jgi:hemoglobin/transferrin/lactoferrin receptor protein
MQNFGVMKNQIWVLLFLFMSFHLQSQEIIGYVYDAKYDRPLADVNIIFEGTSFGTQTNSEGFYSIQTSSFERYTLIATRIGFKNHSQEIDLIDGETIEILIYLQPVKIKLGDEVVITARRMETEILQSPEAITLVSNSRLETELPRSTPEALQGATGVFVQKTNHGGGSPFIRGLTGNQVLLMVDGIRLNNATFRYGPNQYLNTIDPAYVGSIEVIRGGGSALYGSDAIGGVVNVITRNPELSPQGFKVSGSAFGKWISNNMEKTTGAEFLLAGRKASFSGSFSYNDFGNLIAGKGIGEQDPTGYTSYAGNTKLLFKPDKNNTLLLAWQYNHQDDVPRYDKIISGYTKYHFDPQIRTLLFAKWNTKVGSKWINELKWTTSYGQSDEKRKLQKEGQSKLTEEQDIVNTYGFSFEAISKPVEKWNIVSGLEVYYDEVNSKKIIEISGSPPTSDRGYYPDGANSISVALFSNHTLNLKKMIVNFGLRLNTFNINAEDSIFGDVDVHPFALVGNISALYPISATTRISIASYTAFRAPNINDLSSFGAFNYGIEIPNPNLKPEKSVTGEIGIKHGSEQFEGALNFFSTQLTDMIERIPALLNGQDSLDGEKLYKKANFARAFISGFEADAVYYFNNAFSAYFNLTYTYGHNITNDEPIRRIPPTFGRLGLNYIENGFTGSIEWLAASKQSRLSKGDISDSRIPEGGTPGWNILNLRLGYKWNHLHITGGINNIFNQAYRTHGSGVDGAGRCFVAGLKLLF